MFVRLSTSEEQPLNLVGGKAASLIRLHAAGLEVPDGIVLTTQFFERWIADVEGSEAWQKMIEALVSSTARMPGLEARARLEVQCGEIKQSAAQLPLSDEQRELLAQFSSESTENARYAVRSSSPEEDLAGTSFAGLYESRLGVREEEIESAIRTCFLSCLDARVLLYKREMNFTNLSPAIAVVVQTQIPSETAGVAFSLNPLTNDYDEALINASWGVGEALVSGDLTPDTFVIDKISGKHIDARPGDKGGDRSGELCLSNTQVEELIATLKSIETHYGEPIDIEWAYAAGTLHVLQARPITAYVPLAPELQTVPGEQRCLYMDGALTDGLTISGPISPITLDTYECLLRLIFGYIAGVPAGDVDLMKAGMPVGGSRLYLNLSHFLHLSGKGEFLASQLESTNAMVADIVRATDIERYRPSSPPDIYKLSSIVFHLPRILWNLREVVAWAWRPLRKQKFKAAYDAALAEFETWVHEPIDHTEPVSKSVTEWYGQVARTTSASTGPAFIYFMYGGVEGVKRTIDSKDPDQLRLADALRRGYTDNQVVQMGIKLFELAQMLPKEDFRDVSALLARIKERSVPDEFLSAWDQFMHEFGCRGPLEMELENPGYAEAPMQALTQIATISLAGQNFDPREMQEKHVREREAAYEELLQRLPRRKQKKLKRAYENLMTYSHCRELIKHHLMQVNERIRQRLLHLADVFISAGRLDETSQIFELTMNDIDAGMADPDFDLRSAAAAKGAPYQKLKAHLKHFPMMIDSRGRILRPEPKHHEGSLVGTGVSPGIVEGTVKVLNDPFEKEVGPGDVLVAVTTDPGWTPLFINAAAVVIEIGGELQHGALVAREYGKPCVAGIADVTTLLEDGQRVVVDGNAGTVCLLETVSDTAAG